jgi:hypothetical protein
MTSTIFGSKHKRAQDDSDDEDSEVDNDFAHEESDKESEPETDDVPDPEDIDENGSSKVDSYDGEAFDAASAINLDSHKLVDMLAEKDLAHTKELPNIVITLPPASSVPDRVLTEADWDM